MMLTGVLVNGPYALITTAVSANLVSPLYNLSFKDLKDFVDVLRYVTTQGSRFKTSLSRQMDFFKFWLLKKRSSANF